MSIQNQIIQAIAEQLGIDDSIITPEKSLRVDLGADSLDEIELVMTLEDMFGLELSDEECEACRTVQQIIDLISKRRDL